MKPVFVFSIGWLPGPPERQNCKIVHTRPNLPILPLAVAFAPAGSCCPGRLMNVTPSSNLLEARDLYFGYRSSQPVLQGVSLTVPPGELTVLMGPNGSGKSTLLRLLLGQERPWHGEIRLAGQPLNHWSDRDRARRVAFVPQRGALPMGFSVEQAVRMGRFAHGESLRRAAPAVAAALEATDLTELADRPLSELSGGQQRRVLIARALAQLEGAGQLLLLDEPTAGLDLAHIRDLMLQLRSRARQGLAVVIVLHDLTLASIWADRACLLAEGEVQAEGTHHQIFTPSLLNPIYRVPFAWLSDPQTGRRVLVPDSASTITLLS